MHGKFKDILSAERHAQLEKYSSLKKVPKSLRNEQRKFAEQLESEDNEENRQEVESRLKAISKQRKKGLNVLKELKAEREKKTHH
jgi:hypothetical protein